MKINFHEVITFGYLFLYYAQHIQDFVYRKNKNKLKLSTLFLNSVKFSFQYYWYIFSLQITYVHICTHMQTQTHIEASESIPLPLLTRIIGSLASAFTSQRALPLGWWTASSKCH